MGSRTSCITLLAALAFASPAAAQIKCIALPQPAASNGADAGAKFGSARQLASLCAATQAYTLAATQTAAEQISASVVESCKHHVEEQARYAVLAEIGWTREEVLEGELKRLGDTAIEAVLKTRAGACPVNMTPRNYAANAQRR